MSCVTEKLFTDRGRGNVTTELGEASQSEYLPLGCCVFALHVCLFVCFYSKIVGQGIVGHIDLNYAEKLHNQRVLISVKHGLRVKSSEPQDSSPPPSEKEEIT